MTKRHVRSHSVTKVMTHYESIVPHNLCRSKEYRFKRIISSQKSNFDKTTILLFENIQFKALNSIISIPLRIVSLKWTDF